MPTCGESRVKLVTYDSNLTRKAWFIVPYLVLNSLNKIGLLSETKHVAGAQAEAKAPNLSRRADVDSDATYPSSFFAHTAFRAWYTLKFMFYKAKVAFILRPLFVFYPIMISGPRSPT